jgi:hypothetical protein
MKQDFQNFYSVEPHLSTGNSSSSKGIQFENLDLKHRANVWIHIFLASALDGGEWSDSRPCCFTPGERTPGTHWIGGWVDPRAGLDNMEKSKFLPSPGLELRTLGRPARSKSLYRLRYPGSIVHL